MLHASGADVKHKKELTETEAARLRKAYEEGVPLSALARRFNVVEKNIKRVLGIDDARRDRKWDEYRGA